MRRVRGRGQMRLGLSEGDTAVRISVDAGSCAPEHVRALEPLLRSLFRPVATP